MVSDKIYKSLSFKQSSIKESFDLRSSPRLYFGVNLVTLFVSLMVEPSPVDEIVGVATETTLDLSWNPAEGRADEYIIEYTPDWGTTLTPSTTTEEAFTIKGLDPAVDYTVTIITVAGTEESEGAQETFTTGKYFILNNFALSQHK